MINWITEECTFWHMEEKKKREERRKVTKRISSVHKASISAESI